MEISGAANGMSSISYGKTLMFIHQDGSTIWPGCWRKAIREKDSNPARMSGIHNVATGFKESYPS